MTPENGLLHGSLKRDAEWVAGFFFADWVQRLVVAMPPSVVPPGAPVSGVSHTSGPGPVLGYRLGFPAWTLRQLGLTQDSHNRGSGNQRVPIIAFAGQAHFCVGVRVAFVLRRT